MTDAVAFETRHLEIIRAVLSDRIPNNRVWIFGSRAGGVPKPYSDIDLVIIDPPAVAENTFALMKLDFEESNLPFRVDVCVWSQIPTSLQQSIQSSHVEL